MNTLKMYLTVLIDNNLTIDHSKNPIYYGSLILIEQKVDLIAYYWISL